MSFKYTLRIRQNLPIQLRHRASVNNFGITA